MSVSPSPRHVRDTFLPYALPLLGDEEISEVVDTLKSGWLSSGPKVKRFEQEFAEYTGAAHAIAVSSCTAALHIALTALGIGSGDEVIVPTMTFCATANVVAHLGATPTIVDVDESCQISVAAMERAVNSRTKAVIPVHYGGEPCDLTEIFDLAESRGLAMVEDAAHAVGSVYQGRRIGSHGAATAFSFYANKNMTTGEGGMITTGDGDLAARMRRLSLHGMSRSAWNRYGANGSWYYEVEEPGYKNNMTDLQASIGIHQLRRLDGFITRRREIAAAYRRAFEQTPGIELFVEKDDRRSTHHIFPIQVNRGEGTLDRESLINELRQRNIGASVHFIPLHRHPYYRQTLGLRPEQFPVAEKIFSGILSLPLYPGMSDNDVLDVIDTVKSIVNTSYQMKQCA